MCPTARRGGGRTGAEGPAGLSLVRDGRSARVARAQLRFIFATHRSLSFSQIQRGEGRLVPTPLMIYCVAFAKPSAVLANFKKALKKVRLHLSNFFTVCGERSRPGSGGRTLLLLRLPVSVCSQALGKP